MRNTEFRRQHLSPVRRTPGVLLITFNPRLEAHGGVPLWRHMRWNDPDRLVEAYIADLAECSDGLVEYRIVERIEVDAHPVKVDGFRYADESLLRVLRDPARAHRPDGVDYPRLLREFEVLPRVEAGAIDEVWLMGYPYAGFWESTMAGRGAFWCNSPPVPGTEACPRRFVVMGFNYERGVGEMLEDFGHRTESVMAHVFRQCPQERNLWQEFCRYDREAPGRAAVGSVHFAPNSERDYDWGNPRPVPSTCDDWLDFPRPREVRRMVEASEWGGARWQTVAGPGGAAADGHPPPHTTSKPPPPVHRPDTQQNSSHFHRLGPWSNRVIRSDRGASRGLRTKRRGAGTDGRGHRRTVSQPPQWFGHSGHGTPRRVATWTPRSLASETTPKWTTRPNEPLRFCGG